MLDKIFCAPTRQLNSTILPIGIVPCRDEFELPNLCRQVTSLVSMSRLVSPAKKDSKVIEDIYSALKSFGEVLLNNDRVFEFVSKYLLNPQLLSKYQDLVNETYTEILDSDQEIKPGLTKKIPVLKDPHVSWHEFKIAENNYVMQLNSLDMVMLEGVGGIWEALVMPIFTIKNKDDEDGTYIEAGFDIDNETRKIVFVDTLEMRRPDYYVACSFVRPGDDDIVRSEYLRFGLSSELEKEIALNN